MPIPQFHTYDHKLRRAERRAATDATAAQRDAGVARVGPLNVHGLRISVEYPRGATRSGTGADGTKWSRAVKNPYGYIRGTTSTDGEQVDVWLGDDLGSQLAFVVSQLDRDGNLDEHKVVLGCRNYADAKKVIERNYPENWWATRVGEVRGMTVEQLKKWLTTNGPVQDKKKG